VGPTVGRNLQKKENPFLQPIIDPRFLGHLVRSPIRRPAANRLDKGL
jgi:hypothetical protein